MRIRDQLIGALVLIVATYYSVLRIAEAKCDDAVGSLGVRLEVGQTDDFAAWLRLQNRLTTMGQAPLAERIDQLRQEGELWVAPGLGPERWAAYVEALGLLKRIYIRRVALRNPRAHLYPQPRSDIPAGFQDAFAWLSLGGAMRHELAHREGAIEEGAAYEKELEWYREVGRSPFLNGLEGDERAAWDWALESAILSARKAAQQAGVS